MSQSCTFAEVILVVQIEDVRLTAGVVLGMLGVRIC